MNALLPLPVQLGSIGLAAWVLWRASRELPWFKVRDDAEARRVLVAGAVLLIALRLFNTHGVAGMTLHFLGTSIAVLMFGTGFALWIAALASAIMWAIGWAWQGWAVDFLLTGALPAAVTVGVGAFVRLRLPSNIMIYVLGNAAAAGALAIAASVMAKALLSWLSGAEREATLYLLTTPPMMFGEAFFTGGVMVLVVVYRPHWCSSFDDAAYLGVDRRV
ncbi:MAG: energy-coupling factor ABC transporter permease [Pseudoxanthomonas suwonensis]|nr:energy-coupling factor ABC transporter permease [Pseudoxanthomonas suwonensis]